MDYKRAICYSGYREDQSPLLNKYPSYEEIKEDLYILNKNYDILRLYDPSMHAKTVLTCIKQENLDLKIMLGMDLLAEYNNLECPWVKQTATTEELESNIQQNDKALLDLIELANEFSDIIVYLSAGNEARPFWGENLVTEERIVHFVNELKTNCPQKVTYCEGFDVWLDRIPKILEAVDFVSAHIYPLWNDVPASKASTETINCFEQTINSTDKEVIITECGWATESDDKKINSKEATIKNQKMYIEELDSYAKDSNKLIFFFEAFDEPWKGGENPLEPEKHWGVYDVDRNLK